MGTHVLKAVVSFVTRNDVIRLATVTTVCQEDTEKTAPVSAAPTVRAPATEILGNVKTVQLDGMDGFVINPATTV